MDRIIFLVLLFCSGLLQAQPDKIEYWETQKKGTNYFNAHPTREWFESAAKANIKLVRFTYAKWQGEQKDFLIGDADNFKGIVESDFQKLLKFINIADSLGIKVVITPISLPGCRWVQNNNGIRDGRIWKKEKYQKQAAIFWKELASKLKDHPAVVGYNIKNEPHPEIYFQKKSFWKRDLLEWYKSVEGTRADLNLFYSKIIAAIRQVDNKTPIILESGLYGTAWAFDYLEKVKDPKVIYSFHMYEPYGFTTQKLNNNQFEYPGKFPIKEINTDFQLNKKGLEDYFIPIYEWVQKNKVPKNRIWVGEFGCSRKVAGVENYLSDLIEIFNEKEWHWCFYSYREDVWDNMDYELGKEKPHWKYWEYSENQNLHLHYNEIYRKVKNNPIWPVFEKEFKK